MAERSVLFRIGDILFEYDEEKNMSNIKKHGVSFKSAARVFFDYNRIEMYDEENSIDEDRFDTIGRVNALNETYTVGRMSNSSKDILFVVYTERRVIKESGKEQDVTRIISARLATDFERGIYYGKN